jgi:hypothetical protein
MHPVKMSLDIFRKDPQGEVMWVAAADTPASAKAKIDELCLTHPGDYFVFNQETGKIAASVSSGHSRRPAG